MSSISSAYNSVTRMSGLSGLDVDGIVKQLMQIEQAKVDKVSQSRQVLLWKQDKYRSITSALQGFNNEYFNSLNLASDMRSPSAYSAFAIKYGGADTSAYYSATAGAGAKTGDFTISNVVTAQTAKVIGTAVTGEITGTSLTTAGINMISAGADNNKIQVTFNGTTKQINIKENPTDLTDLRNDIQGKLDSIFGSGKITIGISTDKLTFTTSNTNTLSFADTANGGYSAIFGKDLSSGLTTSLTNNRFKITLGSSTKEFELPAGTVYANTDAVISAMQGLVDDSANGFGPGKVNIKNVKNTIVLESADTKVAVSASAASSKGLSALGLSGANISNKINMNANIYDLRNNFATALSVTGADNDISFVINGQNFNFNSRTTSLNSIMTTINSNTSANVRMSYDSTNDKLLLETKQTGVTATITTSESGGGLLGSLSLVATGVKGRDASITFNDGINGDQVVTRSTNSISISGITFNLKKDNVAATTLSLNSDPAKAVDMIKGFVAKYNDLLAKINTMTSEDRNYDYEPLTDTQKEAMTEDQIKDWESKASSGLLSSDATLRAIATNMRNALMETAGNSGLTLSSIGIKSSSWNDKGKLYIDEDKLKKALTENPDQVISLFTNTSDVTYNVAATDSTKRTERFKESGLINRLSDILQDNIRTTTINGQRGALLEKAGMTGDRSMYNNTLYNQITDYDEKITSLNQQLSDKENSYYAQFSQLETLISNMNSQSSWLTQQFSS
jgi:flagellar hook-associated protein 2